MREEKIVQLKQLVEPLLAWYDIYARTLPFRLEGNPYSIWISEIMLQQTRMEAVIEYYNRFIKELPTVKDLAEVEEDRLLKLWEGLGYYNRARNLKKAAVMIVEEYNEVVPDTVEELLKLPGIGPYTAGAIASIAYQKKAVAVDGNVLRVLSRYLASYARIDEAKTKKEMEGLLLEILPERVGDFNQAIMELGALICLPNGTPLCEDCPLQNACLANKLKVQLELPCKASKKKRKEDFLTVLIIRHQDKILLERRQESSLLNGLWQLPNRKGKATEEEIRLEYALNEKDKVSFLEETKHIFTSTEWNMQPVLIELANWKEIEGLIVVDQKQLEEEIMLPTAFRKLLD